jgi:hypothetical protein
MTSSTKKNKAQVFISGLFRFRNKVLRKKVKTMQLNTRIDLQQK